MNPVRAMLVDDHVLVRAGIRSLLQALGGVTVVAEADDGCDALELVRNHHPDIVLMDIAMRCSSGLEITAQIKTACPNVHVIILSMHVDEENVLQALRAGASGYLVKDAAISELEVALQAVMRGDTYLCPRVSRQVVDNYLRRIGGEQKPHDPLTPRQREILALIAGGKSTKEIAFSLHLSGKTVESHRAQLMERLDIHDIPGLVRYAMRIGLLAVNQ